ncbi:peptidase C65 otubain protein [Ceratobasidium sp. AG-Ba]|nr:peptidase C65 otubain protein [Ceratobasidium sp. AG-Ba]
MSLTTVSSASFHIPVPRVFGLGLGRDPSPPPPAPRRRNTSSSPRKRPSSPARAGPSSSAQPRTPNPPRPSTQPRASGSQQPRATFARVRHRRRAPTVSSISTLSSLISSTIPPPTELPPPPSLTAALRTLEKLKIPNTIRVEGWRAGVADATGSEPMGAAGNEPVARTEPAPNVAPPAAVAAASAERSNLRSLSDEDIFALTQNIKNEEASRRPLVSPISPLSELRAEFSPLSEAVQEYTGPNSNVLRKIDWLQKHGGWSGIRRTRGDGDCFYRSLAFAYVEKIMTAPEPGLAVATSLSHLESTLPLLEQAGFQKIVFEDFYESFAELIQHIVPPAGKVPLTNEELLKQFQNPEVSNSIVVFLRLLTSSYIRLSPEDDFTPFLFHPDTGDMVDVRTFVEMFVEATGREADHPQIMALSKALRVRIEVAYLDNSSGTVLDDGTVRVDFVKFAPEGAEKDGTKPVVLLYRPGHYDTLEEKVEG